MSKLPAISGRSCVKALEKTGFYLKRWEGSHMILRRDNPFAEGIRFLSAKIRNLCSKLSGRAKVTFLSIPDSAIA